MVAPVEKPESLMDALRFFTPDAADRYVESIKWPDGPCCSKCGSVNVGRSADGRVIRCREKGCRRKSRLTADTIMHDTHLRLDQWCLAMWLIANCRNGVSSCEIARHIGCKQQSAWHLLHRVRHVLKEENARQLHGAVEADTTFVGGLLKHISPKRRKEHHQRRGWGAKSVVHAMLERRTGIVRAEIVESEEPAYIRPIIEKHIQPGSLLSTDASYAYTWAGAAYVHRWVNHGAGEYVKGAATTNRCENFFNCLRRGLKGTYIAARPEHLAAYVDEQVWRFNNRRDSEWERFNRAMHLIVGKRLTYSALTDGAVR
jgi:hypothetical protein